MAAGVKYYCAMNDLASKVHDWVGTGGSSADLLKIALTNAAPNVATHTVLANITELSNGGGYTSGGATTANVGSMASGVLTVVGTDYTWNFTGSPTCTFRYVVLYNSTAGSGPLIQYWDVGTIGPTGNGDTFLADFGASMFTLG